ncbi:urate hydroxylase PuuD [Archangium lansingense]|uniref:Urate hydroxylase PuuD n=1 Tax=Archangium lansingense TaxID=2995310 RepID=A0ABT4ABB5_9BACT|nr:urate hydroxylase PuuD [Archangium lansinium]MCY1078973.1 urate hydroxylase PuuD [Archangium lansinium]
MSAFIQEWLNLLVRWVHVIAAIMWIGDSFLFMWLDSHLTSPSRPREGAVVGELWMTHSGGFYEVVKRKSLAKGEMPDTLYWFKWESYTTWISGFLLLIIVFHLNGASLLIDSSVYPLTAGQAAAISLGVLPLAYGLYELLWKTPLAKNNRVFAAVGFVLITALAYALTRVFSARGAFLQVGATLGTIMAANVFFRIIPAQRHMLAMTREGKPVDTSYGLRAKGRSIQNHYLTLPVLFTMISNHFPSTYGGSRPWLVLGLLFVVGAGLKYVMNFRAQTPPLAWAGTAAALLGVIVLTRPPPDPALEQFAGKPPVKFEEVASVMQTRCATCHAARPSSPMFAAPPLGIILDRPDAIRAHADRVFVRAVATKTMPLGNLTGMTEEERSLVGAWFAQGGAVPEGAKMPDFIAPPVAAPAPAPAATPGTALADIPESSRNYFASVCSTCHGPKGAGDGAVAAALNPKPRNFGDKAWQDSITDEALKKVIVEGGAAVGKSAVMPPNPPLAEDTETLNGLVKLIRAFGA